MWEKIFPDYYLDINTVNTQIKALYKKDEDLATLLIVFSSISILLVCIGLFSLSVLSLNQRKKEIGIRKVIGAKINEIHTMLNKEFLKYVLVAFVIATPIAYYVSNNWLNNFAYRTTLDWWVFVLPGIFCFATALLTISWKSYSEASRNPVEAIQNE